MPSLFLDLNTLIADYVDSLTRLALLAIVTPDEVTPDEVTPPGRERVTLAEAL